MAVIVIGDSAADLPIEYIKKENIPIMSYPYNIDDTPITGDIGDAMTPAEYYDKIRNGAMVQTSQLNYIIVEETVRKYLANGDSVVLLCLSSKLSSTYSNILVAKDRLKEEFPNGEFHIVDSKSATWGEGIQLRRAIQMRNQGASASEIVNWLTAHVDKVNLLGFVDDLECLRRGGRLSNIQAFLGTMLSIKPLIYFDKAGYLCGGLKVRGHQKAMRTLRDLAVKYKPDMEDGHIVIFHSDKIEFAGELEGLLKEADNYFTCEIMNLGPVIGAHTGPNTVAMTFFTKSDREEPKL